MPLAVRIHLNHRLTGGDAFISILFGHRKVRYKGLVKNTAQLFSLFGLANLVLARKLLLASEGRNPS